MPYTNQKYYESFWTSNDTYFSGRWWLEDDKLALAASILAAEAKAKGGISMTDTLASIRVTEANNKLITIQALSSTMNKSTGAYPDTLNNLTTILGKYGYDWGPTSNGDYILTEDQILLLTAYEKNLILRGFGKWYQRGGALIVDGIFLVFGGLIVAHAPTWFGGDAGSKTPVIGKMNDLNTIGENEYRVADLLPNQGTPKAN